MVDLRKPAARIELTGAQYRNRTGYPLPRMIVRAILRSGQTIPPLELVRGE